MKGSHLPEQSTGYLNTHLNNDALPEHRRPSGHVLYSRSGAEEPWPAVAGSAQFAGPGGLRSSLPGPSGAAQLACWLSLIWATKVLTAGKARSGRSRKMV
jgi:hypothetical protein